MANDKQKGFIVYGDTKAIVDELSDEQAGRLFRGMLNYFVDGDVPEFTGELKFAFIPIRQQMDRDSNKYAKMCDRNKKNASMRWDAVVCGRIRSDAVDANTNTNTNTNKDKNTESHRKSDDVSSLISFLNSETGSHYKDTEQIRTLIEKKLDEGYSVEDIRTVIRNKSLEWSCDAKMRSYLRPSTLFGDKFDEYLNAPEPKEVEEERFESDRKEKLQIELEQYTNSLAEVNEQINLIQGEGVDDSNRDRLTQLRFDAAHYEDVINNLVRRMEKSG